MNVEIKEETFDKVVENAVKSQVCLAVKEEMGKDLVSQKNYIALMTADIVNAQLASMNLSEVVTKFLEENRDSIIEQAGVYLAKTMTYHLGLD